MKGARDSVTGMARLIIGRSEVDTDGVCHCRYHDDGRLRKIQYYSYSCEPVIERRRVGCSEHLPISIRPALTSGCYDEGVTALPYPAVAPASFSFLYLVGVAFILVGRALLCPW